MTTAQHKEASKIATTIALHTKELIDLTKGLNDRDAREVVKGIEQLLDGCQAIINQLKQYEL